LAAEVGGHHRPFDHDGCDDDDHADEGEGAGFGEL
jgi:hypothetical protein